MTSVAASASSFLEQFRRAQQYFSASDAPWLARMRDEGISQFASAGVPTRQDEAWKFTDLHRVLRDTEFLIADNGEAPSSTDVTEWLPLDDGTTPRVTFVNGRFRPELSTLDRLPKNVTFESFHRKLATEPAALQENLEGFFVPSSQPLLALNTAFMADGFLLHIGQTARVGIPIEIIFVGGLSEGPVAYHPRNLIVLEEDSQATVLERHIGIGDDTYFSNSATEIRVGDRATLRHYSEQSENSQAVRVATVHSQVGHEATYETFELAMGGRLARREVSVRLAGRGAHCNISGAYLLRNRQHCDNTTVIEHKVPGTSCREVFKGAVDDHARSVFQGKILINRQAQQSDGHQMSKALLLAPTAEADMKPELEIYADDVRCSHGATTGRLDNEALYYLRSRGLAEPLARRLLIESFIKEALDEVSFDALRTAWVDEVASWLVRKDEAAA